MRVGLGRMKGWRWGWIVGTEAEFSGWMSDSCISLQVVETHWLGLYSDYNRSGSCYLCYSEEEIWPVPSLCCFLSVVVDVFQTGGLLQDLDPVGPTRPNMKSCRHRMNIIYCNHGCTNLSLSPLVWILELGSSGDRGYRSDRVKRVTLNWIHDFIDCEPWEMLPTREAVGFR